MSMPAPSSRAMRYDEALQTLFADGYRVLEDASSGSTLDIARERAESANLERMVYLDRRSGRVAFLTLLWFTPPALVFAR